MKLKVGDLCKPGPSFGIRAQNTLLEITEIIENCYTCHGHYADLEIWINADFLAFSANELVKIWPQE